MPTHLDRITFDPAIMGGKPCLRGLRVTAGMPVGLIASGHNREEILTLYPYLEEEDITQALRYAAWRTEEIEIPLAPLHEVSLSYPHSNVGCIPWRSSMA